MKTCVFDIECDGFNPTKIHCLSAAVFSQGEWRIKSTTNYDEMRKFFSDCDEIVGHSITRFDVPVAEKILGIKIKARVIDTLALSWYLYPYRVKHGLADWGEEFGVPKPKVEDWDNLPIETYIHRCNEDVRINCKLWDKQWDNLTNLYDDDIERTNELIDYLGFKMYCAMMAEKSKWKLDVDLCTSSLETLESLKEEKVEELRVAMPELPIMFTINKPKKLYKKDGELSSAGLKWTEKIISEGLEEDREEPIEFQRGFKEPNPNSVPQIKDWLYSLGWKPITFKFNGTKEVEQVRVDVGGEKKLCESVKRLIEVEPSIEALDGLSVLTHRIGILKGYLSNVDEDGYVQARISGLTNTLRFKHSVIVNLPAANKPYGDIVRGVLTAPDGYELCGSDMSSLENRTAEHFMYEYDKEYVEERNAPDFDSHTDMAVVAGLMTEEEEEFFKWYNENN